MGVKPRVVTGLICLMLSAVSCRAEAPAGEERADDEHAVVDSAAHDAHGSHAAEGEPLLSIMQRLGSEMTALTYGLMTDDRVGVARSAGAIAEHVPIAEGDLARIRAALGADMARFEAFDGEVHEASVRLRDAAAGGSPDSVVARLGEVQRGCVACHAAFRDRLRTGGGAAR